MAPGTANTAEADFLDSLDGKEAARASELITRAERHLDEDETSEALYLANEALGYFRSLEESSSASIGTANALHVMILAYRLEREKQKEKPSEADTLAEESLAYFSQLADRRGEAVIKLAIAQINSDRRGPKRRDKALQLAVEAVEVFRDLQEHRLEGLAHIEIAGIFFKMKRFQDHSRETDAALEIAKTHDDLRLKAFALHQVALSNILRVQLATGKARWQLAEKATAFAQEAADSFKKLGLKKREAGALHIKANILLNEKMPQKALAPAQEALGLFQGDRSGFTRGARTLQIVADTLIKQKRSEEAINVVKAEVDRLQSLKDDRGRLGALEVLVHTYSSTGDLDSALQSMSEALDLARTIQDRYHELELLELLYQLHLKQQAAEEAMEALYDARALARELQSDAKEASLLILIASLYADVGDNSKALRVAAQAQDAYELLGDKEGEGRTLYVAARICQADGNTKEFLDKAAKAKRCFQQAGDRGRESQVLDAIADMHLSCADHTAAMEAARSCLNLNRSIGNTGAEADAMQKLARIQSAAGNNADSLASAQEALKLHHRAKNRRGEALTQVLIASTLIGSLADPSSGESEDETKKVLDKASRAVYEAISLAGQAFDKNLRGVGLYWRAQVCAWRGLPEDGLKVAAEARSIFQQTEDRGGEIRALIVLAQLHFSVGKAKDALQLSQEALEIAQDVNDSEGESLALECIERFEVKKASQVQEVVQIAETAEELHEDQAPEEAAVAAPEPVVEDTVALTPETVKPKLIEIVKDMLTLENDDDLHEDSPLMAMGMDSLASVAFATALKTQFGVRLSPTLIFEYPNVLAITDHIIEEVS
jgi:tetratricopeptide (TPR) repeat protein/acyl carrier protein